LAKELGVKSTAIVKKCQNEGLDIKNHMTVISAGLAATIREWFGEGKTITAVETAEKVDLKKVRIKKEVKRKRVTKKEKAAKQTKVEPGAEVVKVEAEAPADKEIEDTGPGQQAAAVVIEKPAEPEPIVPAGPILEKPEPARLSGPKVVRVEKPEPI